MTQKEIVRLAADPGLMFILEEIVKIQQNMCHKTIYEKKTAAARIHDYAQTIQNRLKEKMEEEKEAKVWCGLKEAMRK